MWPFRGFGYFITHPRMWAIGLFSTLILALLLLAVFLFVMIVTWPNLDTNFWHKLWDILKSLGFSTTAMLFAFIVLMPLMLTVALDKMVRKVILYEENQVVETTFFRSVYSGTVVFFKTIFWRIFWPIVGLVAAIFLGPIGAFISQVGIGHLAAIDAVDLALALKGYKAQKRMELHHQKAGQIFGLGVSAGILSLGLSVTVLGWILWIPAIFTGATLWVLEWPELKQKNPQSQS